MRMGGALRAGVTALLLAAGAAGLAPGGAPLGPARAHADEGWRAEFDDVCSKTQDAMALSTEELRSLVARCEALAPKIAALDEPRRKVFGRRLEACRNLYQYVLEHRAKAAP